VNTEETKLLSFPAHFPHKSNKKNWYGLYGTTPCPCFLIMQVIGKHQQVLDSNKKIVSIDTNFKSSMSQKYANTTTNIHPYSIVGCMILLNKW